MGGYGPVRIAHQLNDEVLAAAADLTLGQRKHGQRVQASGERPGRQRDRVVTCRSGQHRCASQRSLTVETGFQGVENVHDSSRCNGVELRSHWRTSPCCSLQLPRHAVSNPNLRRVVLRKRALSTRNMLIADAARVRGGPDRKPPAQTTRPAVKSLGSEGRRGQSRSGRLHNYYARQSL